MLISFIVPVYNTELYLEECLDSLLNQNISHDEYEIICVNDGSTDSSSAILHNYASKYHNLVVIDKENGGVSSARNVGIDVAKGDYIWFFDSDDVLKSNSLLNLKSIITENNFDRIRLGIFVFNGDASHYIDDNELKINSHATDSNVFSSLLSRSFICEHKCRFNTDLAYCEDSVFMFEINSHNPTLFVVDKPLYLYRNRENSAMTSFDVVANKKKIKSHFISAKIMKDFYDNNVGNPVAAANFMMSFTWLTLNLSAKMPKPERKQIIKAMKKNGLFPCKRPSECTLIKSYQTTRTDILGKIFDWIYIHSHTHLGYFLMLLYEKFYRLYSQAIKK